MFNYDELSKSLESHQIFPEFPYLFREISDFLLIIKMNKANTTGKHPDSTLSAPNVKKIIHSVAMILENQMREVQYYS